MSNPATNWEDAYRVQTERISELRRENAELRQRLHKAEAESDLWASRCGAALWLLPETVTGNQLRETQDKFHRLLSSGRKEAHS